MARYAPSSKSALSGSTSTLPLLIEFFHLKLYSKSLVSSVAFAVRKMFTC